MDRNDPILGEVMVKSVKNNDAQCGFLSNLRGQILVALRDRKTENKIEL